MKTAMDWFILVLKTIYNKKFSLTWFLLDVVWLLYKLQLLVRKLVKLSCYHSLWGDVYNKQFKSHKCYFSEKGVQIGTVY